MVTVQIATLPERENLLEKAVNSLINQVDQINVMLNGHEDAPHFLKQLEFHTDKIAYFAMDNSTGDAAKFFRVEKLKGYIFTCDDDLIYPGNYVEKMVSKLKEHSNKVILSCHGRKMNIKPVTSIYSDRIATYPCTMFVIGDYYVEIGGTGVMAWHTNYFKPEYSAFKRKNMADVWVAKQASEQGCKILVMGHPDKWLIPTDLDPNLSTIWKDKYGNDEKETEIYNSF